MNRKHLTTFSIAKHCQVTHRTVQQWISDGKLKSFRTPGNHNRVELIDFFEFLKQYNMPIPEDFNNRQLKRILVVDDDKTMVMIIKKMLGDGYIIEHAYDGFNAGKKFAEFKPDLVTLDINLPYLGGEVVLKTIREDAQNKNVKVMVISGITDKMKQKDILGLGADIFLVKPIDREVLLKNVKELLRGQYDSL